MKLLFALGLFALCCAAVSGLEDERAVEFNSEYEKLAPAIANIRAKILAEHLSDTAQLNELEAAMNEAKAKYDVAKKLFYEAKAAYDAAVKANNAAKAHLAKAEAAYTAGKAIRDAESATILEVRPRLEDLASHGAATNNAVGTLAALPADLQERVKSMRSFDSKSGFVSSLSTLEASIATEEAADLKRRDSARAAQVITQTAEDEALALYWLRRDERMAAYEVYKGAKAAYDEFKVTYDAAEANRASQEAALKKLEAEIANMKNIRTAEATAEIQGANEDLIMAAINEMEKIVRLEDKHLLELVQMLEKEAEAARLAMLDALAAKNAADEVNRIKQAAKVAAIAAWKAAAAALSEERATAAEERKMIADLRVALDHLQNTQVQTGNCPIVNGRFCAGAGSCINDECMCNPHHEGDACGVCEAGYTMVNGVCIASMSDLQMMQKFADLQVSVMRNKDQAAGIQGVLNGMLATLDAKDAELSAIEAAAKAAMEKATQEAAAAYQALLDATKVYEDALEAYTEAKALYETVALKYETDSVFFRKEYASFALLRTIVSELLGVQATYTVAHPK
jgi:hypothetical protein